MKAIEQQSNQLNLAVVSLVALVAIVGLVALVLNTASVADIAGNLEEVSTGSILAPGEPADASDNVVGDVRAKRKGKKV